MIIKKTFRHKITKQFMGFDVETIFNKKDKEFDYSAFTYECDSPIDYYGETTTIEILKDYMVNMQHMITSTEFDNIIKDWELVKLKIEIMD